MSVALQRVDMHAWAVCTIAWLNTIRAGDDDLPAVIDEEAIVNELWETVRAGSDDDAQRGRRFAQAVLEWGKP